MKENMNELLYMYRTGDAYARDRLIEYCRMVCEITLNGSLSSYTDMGYMRDDLLQEALFYSAAAIDSYREDKSASIKTFITTVIRHRVWNIVRRENNKQAHAPDLVYLDKMIRGGSRIGDLIAMGQGMHEPEYYTAYRGARERLLNSSHLFTAKELDAFHAHQTHDTPEECADSLHCTKRAYDARIRKIRKKISYDILGVYPEKKKHD